jgi:hypothetical protein
MQAYHCLFTPVINMPAYHCQLNTLIGH